MPWTGGVSNIPKGWILCDGGQISAKDYPLLARAIGDTYNNGPSSFAGNFPDYTGNIVLPSITNKNLMDIEPDYFGQFGTGSTLDSDIVASSTITPLIGENTDNGIKTIYNDVTTDVVFTLNERSGFVGKISGNVISGGDGSTKTVYVSPRKLGRDHIKSHNHPGNYTSLRNSAPMYPGLGVIPYENIDYQFISNVSYDDDDPTIGPKRDMTINTTVNYIGPNSINANNGFGEGLPGRVMANVIVDQLRSNFIPIAVLDTPLTSEFLNRLAVTSSNPILYGEFERGVNVPAGSINFYPDISGTRYTNENTFDTTLTPSAWDFEKISNTAGASPDSIYAHEHEEFDVAFVRGSLKANSSLTVEVEAPNANLNLDNQSNAGVLQINFNTTQPGVTCIYVIRAY